MGTEMRGVSSPFVWRVSTDRLPRSWGIRLAMSCALVAMLAPVPADAHELDETREAVLSFEGDDVLILLGWSVPPGPLAEQVRMQLRPLGAAWVTEDARERLVGAALVPRMWRGLEVSVEGARRPPVLDRIHLRDAAGSNVARGFEAMAVLRVPQVSGVDGPGGLEVEFHRSGLSPVVLLVVQRVADGLSISVSGLPEVEEGQVWGPGPVGTEGGSGVVRIRVRAEVE